SVSLTCCCCSFFFNCPAPTEIYTLSLHDALPILHRSQLPPDQGLELRTRDQVVVTGVHERLLRFDEGGLRLQQVDARRCTEAVAFLDDAQVLRRDLHGLCRERDLLLGETQTREHAFEVRAHLATRRVELDPAYVRLHIRALHRVLTAEAVEDRIRQRKPCAPARAPAVERCVLVEPVVATTGAQRGEVLRAGRAQAGLTCDDV